ncbi:diaminobutyrate acetyltransferase [Cohnella hongkongensis]|uniref:L-2,4-diaminobutyric acid acetyltransferase n=1 Tax=Cohnella hongkongensis TaxID=178337 RepID=A0ABV9FC16_9BACL
MSLNIRNSQNTKSIVRHPSAATTPGSRTELNELDRDKRSGKKPAFIEGGSKPNSSVTFRIPGEADGALMWEMARDSGRLDLNSAYFYLAMSRWFGDSCRIAVDEAENSPVGFVLGFRQPASPDTLFVWQIAVAESRRGQGIAGKLLDEVTGQEEIRYVEATVAPSNAGSRAMFEKWARSRGLEVGVSPGFEERCFPGHAHEREELYRIGPIR